MQFENILDVVEVASLNEAYAKRFTKPWLTQNCEGETVEYDTEEQACFAQRAAGYQLSDLIIAWRLLGDVPVNEDDELEEAFFHFEAGTDRSDVWAWFESKNPEFSVAKAQAFV